MAGETDRESGLVSEDPERMRNDKLAGVSDGEIDETTSPQAPVTAPHGLPTRGPSFTRTHSTARRSSTSSEGHPASSGGTKPERRAR